MKKILLLAIYLGILVTGCGCPISMPAYIQADEATFQAVEPDYRKYIEESDMSEEDKKRRSRTLQTWKNRIHNAKEAYGEK